MPTDQPNLFDHLPSKAVDDAMMILVEAFRAELDMPEVLAYPIARQGGEKALRALKDAGYHLSIDGLARAADEDVVEIGTRHPATARAMADRMLPRSGAFRRTLIERLAAAPDGMTDYEIEEAYHRSHQSASGARSTLKSDGWVMPLVRDGVTVTRVNEFGNDAIAWTVTPAARVALAAAPN